MNTQSGCTLGVEIAFVDAGVADSDSLVSQFQPGTEVHLLSSSQDAIAQITQVLANRSNVSAVHLLSHGSDGALLLGSKTVSDLSDYQAELQQWSDSLTADADILLYGCNVAADSTGKSFVNKLAQLTGADVAASDDLTGLGGDWTLEYQTGTIETAAIAGTAYQGTLANFRVTTLNDVVDPTDNVISLREAVNTANTLGGSNNIFFNVNGTITLTGGELGISSNLSIYGNGASFTQISGNSASRVFNVSNNNVLLSGLTIANGRAGGDGEGGGIRNSGNLTVQNCTFSGNEAVRGSGIFNVGILTVNSSTFSANSAAVDGGGIVNVGNLTVNSSTFSGNSAFFGGGIYNRRNLTVNSSTFSGNSAGIGGGIINLASTMTVTGSYFLNNQAPDGGGIAIDGGASTLIGNVISQNQATNRGGGVFTNSGTVYLQLNNISSNTAATGVDLFGSYFSGGFNLIGKGGGFTGINNNVNGDVILVP